MNTGAVITAIVCGGLVGLYLYGKHIKKSGRTGVSGKLKIQGENLDDLSQKMEGMGLKSKVQFEQVDLLTYENIVKWINETDLKDADSSSYGCIVIRTAREIEGNGFNLDFSDVPSEQLDNVYGTVIVDETNRSIVKERWMICAAIDEDIARLMKQENLINLK